MEKINYQSGNVLFLILIAVALFAALSYAVTSSTRSSGDASGEKGVITISAITQYPATVRAALTRMMLAGKFSSTELDDFETSSFGPPTPVSFDDPDISGTSSRYVFRPEGGGVAYQFAPESIVADHLPYPSPSQPDGYNWRFNMRNAIQNIGTSKTDMIAFLVSIKKDLCDQINKKNGVAVTPTVSTALFILWNETFDDSDTTPGDIIGTGASALLAGKPEGCFLFPSHSGTTANNYMYYQVLIER